MKKIFISILFCIVVLSGCENLPLTTNKIAEENKTVSQQIEQEIELKEPPEHQSESIAKNDIIIVIDPGHGKSSSLMSDTEKSEYGYKYVDGRGWGDWRHFKSGTIWQDCEASGCNMRVPSGGSCWYPITKGDRETEPDLNYNNALNAKRRLEELGYAVRITRSEDENPSLSQRLKHCYPDGDTTKKPDASAYICLHSNAGGGSGSCYISLSGLYDQAGIPDNYVEASNDLGKTINDFIVQNTPLTASGDGKYDGYPELVLFFKSPIPVAYMEIGFYDNPNDLTILQAESKNIGTAIANGIDAYFSKQ